MPHIKHTCLVSLVAFSAKEDNVTDQPAYIQELSSVLEKAYGVLLDRVKPQNSYCRLCQIAPKINKVTERAQYLQIHESPSQNMPGAFAHSTHVLREELKEDCCRLIQMVKSIIWDDRTRPFPQNGPVGEANVILYTACDAKNHIMDDSRDMSYQDEGGRPVWSEKSKLEDATGNLIYNIRKSRPSERPTMAQIVQVFAALQSLLSTCTSYTAAPSLLPESPPSIPATFQALITALDEQTISGPVISEVIVVLVGELLDLLENNAASELSTSDIELLLDFLHDLLRKNGLANSGVRSARRLLFKLITMTDAVPRSLFINDVITVIDPPAMPTAHGGFGDVLRGEYAGQLVALKGLHNFRHQELSSLQKDFCSEALAWRSISHRFSLPLLGIYEEKSKLYLVSPFMTNGTLRRWRREQRPDVVEIHRVMLEVAEAIQYLHSQGIVHGDIHGGNVLLDSEFHCQITDFGLTRSSEATAAWTTNNFVPNYAAPELLGICGVCDQKGCEGGHPGYRATKTLETDVYAFGCLYYEIFFDAIPFRGKTPLQILTCILRETRPERLESPRIEEKTWDIIENCWVVKPRGRPTMDEIVETMTCRNCTCLRRAVVSRAHTC